MEKDEDQLKGLREELQKAETDLAEANEMLANAQKLAKERTAKKSALQPLQRMVDDIDANQLAAKNQREAADKEKGEAEAVRDDLSAQLQKQLSEDHCAGIDKVIEEVDGEIRRLQQDVQTRTQEIATAEESANQAKDKVTSLEAGFREAQAQLRQLPAQITAAQSRVVRLKDAARSAADSGRASDAYILLKDLERAIEALKSAADPSKETQLQGFLLTQWPDLEQAKKEAENKAKKLEPLKGQQTKAEQDLKRKEQGRDAAIKERLAAEPKPPEQS